MNSAPLRLTRSLTSKPGTPEDANMANESIDFRLARYLEHIRNKESENNQRFLQEADNRLAEQQDLHAKELQALRDEYANQIRSNREKIENVLENRVKVAEKASQRDKEALNDALKTLSAAYNRIDESNSKVSVLEQINAALHDRVRNLQTSLDDEQAKSMKLQTEVNRLREDLALKYEEYQNQMEEESSISSEIAAFDKLLSSAEKRLKLSTSNMAKEIRKTTSK